MKKKIFIMAVTIVGTATFLFNKKIEIKKEETRGVFISYIEYTEYFQNKNEEEIENIIKDMVNKISNFNLNTIYLQVRMFSDSIYNSKIFPYTNLIATKVDVLKLFIKYSKKKNIKVYAWINPYRISSNTDINKISKDNPAYKYLNTNNIGIIENKGIYYNPASNIVKNLIIAGVVEIITNYDVNGIIFDDYFYPDNKIDLENYEEYRNKMTLTEFRLNQVNELISKLYKTIKKVNKNLEFGISPDGNIINNYEIHYADVKRWLSEDGYIDFIIPQLYYGFDHEILPFDKALEEWNNLIKNNTKLIVGLGLYKSGKIDEYAKSGKYEWQQKDDILKSQLEMSSEVSSYNGFALYRFDYIFTSKNKYLDHEIKKIKKIIKKY